MLKLDKYYSTIKVSLERIKTSKDVLNSKIKGTIIEKWVTYWKVVGRDYKDVAISVKQQISNKPIKAALYFTAAGFLGFCVKLNPDLKNFRDKHIRSSNELNLVNHTLVNPTAADHLKYIQRCFNHNLIRHINLGILSIIWVDKYSEECDLYENNCSYLKVPYWGIFDRILDIGFLNVWWITSRKMLDYDINY